MSGDLDRLFDLETLGGIVCPHCPATRDEETELVSGCVWIAERTGLERIPYPKGCLAAPHPRWGRIPF